MMKNLVVFTTMLLFIACGVGREDYFSQLSDDSSGPGKRIDDAVGQPPEDVVTDQTHIDMSKPEAEPEHDIPIPPADLICIPDCFGKECGDDGCGGSCGWCPAGIICNPNGLCINGDPPDCDGKVCGPDGVGGSCGNCPCDGCGPGQTECDSGQCIAPQTPGNGCPEIFECFTGCEQNDDQGCYMDCINNAPIDGQAAYYELVDCLDKSGYFDCPADDNECYTTTFEPCYDPYYECYHGDLSCLEMYICGLHCPEGYEGNECVSDCYGSGTAEAQKTYYALIDCLDESGYMDCESDDEECYQVTWDACIMDFKECTHGDFSCQQVVTCMDDCNPMDQYCWYECYMNGTIEDQLLYDSLLACVDDVCGENSSGSCSEEAVVGPCADIYNACLAP